MSLSGRIRHFFLRCRRQRPAPATDPCWGDMVMGSEVDYFGLANLLIDQCGAGAKAEAVRLLQEARHENDDEAASDWLTVEHAIALLAGDSAATRNSRTKWSVR